MLIIRVVVLALVTGLAHAHHSFQVHYDASKTIELQGVVKDFRFRSPHGVITLDVASPDGSVTPWKIELGSVPSMQRKGVNKETIKQGDVISVSAMPNRKPGTPLVLYRTIITRDGTMLGEDLKLADAGQVDGGSYRDRLSGRWKPIMGPEPIIGETPFQLTAAGRSAWENFDPEQSQLNKCEPPKVPELLSKVVYEKFIKRRSDLISSPQCHL